MPPNKGITGVRLLELVWYLHNCVTKIQCMTLLVFTVLRVVSCYTEAVIALICGVI
jgi:hypothetical protein